MIIRNQARCLKCDDHIMSAGRHNFVSCRCGNLFVDGGVDYLRRGVSDGTHSYKETSISLPVRIPIEKARDLLLMLQALASLRKEWISPPVARHIAGDLVRKYPWFEQPTIAEAQRLLEQLFEFGLVEKTEKREGFADYRTDKEFAEYRG